MSILFKPFKVRNVKIKNRYIHSATYEAMATEDGEVTDELLKRYRNLARGEVGLIIPGYMYVHSLGKAVSRMTGINDDSFIPGLKQLADTVHEEGSSILFQLAHAGQQTKKQIIDDVPMAPSADHRDPILFFKPREMSQSDIEEVIFSFGEAAMRAALAGADGVQIHAAHGYLVNEFLSPFYNHRKDQWGGSDENRFRFFREIYSEVRRNLPAELIVSVKLNACDFTPHEGIDYKLAARYTAWMADLGIDLIEISCGGTAFSYMNMVRGDVPVKELARSVPAVMRPAAWLMLKGMAGKFDFEGPYNLEAVKQVRQVTADTPLSVVGGIRTVQDMESIITAGHADFVSMSRPFIREPHLVKKIREGTMAAVNCTSCNRCFGEIVNGSMLRCYNSEQKRHEEISLEERLMTA